MRRFITIMLTAALAVAQVTATAASSYAGRATDVTITANIDNLEQVLIGCETIVTGDEIVISAKSLAVFGDYEILQEDGCAFVLSNGSREIKVARDMNSAEVDGKTVTFVGNTVADDDVYLSCEDSEKLFGYSITWNSADKVLRITETAETSKAVAVSDDVVSSDKIRQMLYSTGITDETTLEETAVNISDATDRRSVADIIGDNGTIRLPSLNLSDVNYKTDDGAFDADAIEKAIDGEDCRDYGIYDASGKYCGEITLSADGTGGHTYTVVSSSSTDNACDFDRLSEIISSAGDGSLEYIRLCHGVVGNVIFFEKGENSYVIPFVEISAGDEVFKAFEAADALKFFTATDTDGAITFRGTTSGGGTGKNGMANHYINKILESDGCIFRRSGTLPTPRPTTDNRAAYSATAPLFTDISEGTLLNTCVNELAAMGVVSGYDDGTFLPLSHITRAEVAAMLARMTKLSGGASDFGDIAADAWYAESVGAAAETGLMTGYDDGTFRPENDITYHELIKIAYCVLGRPELEYGSVVENAASDGLTSELSSFASEAPITRSDAAILLSRVYDSYVYLCYPTIMSPFAVGMCGNPEMTLADYLSGVTSDGEYFSSEDACLRREDEIEELYFSTYTDILREYIEETNLKNIPARLKEYLGDL